MYKTQIQLGSILFILEYKNEKIELMNDFIHSPLWYSTEDEFDIRDDSQFDVFYHDDKLNAIADEIADMYTSYYEFDSHDQGCWFNEEQEKADATKMLSLITKLKARLDELNDGTFIIEDHLTKFYQDLVNNKARKN